MKKIPLLSLFLASASAFAETGYDQEMLKALGYDASAAYLLESGSRFLPGAHPTNIIVNRQSKGTHIITFDQSGTPCWTTELLRTLGINPVKFKGVKDDSCLLPGATSGIHIDEQIKLSTLELRVPPDELLKETQYATGGKALIVNYDGRHYTYQNRSGARYSSQALTSEVGANFQQWIFRSGQSYTSQNNQGKLVRLYSYGQRSIPGWSSMLQFGELSSNDPLFAGITFTGAQLIPERALQEGGANRVTLNVLMSQAGTVEVLQNNILLKVFQVSAGMNTLNGVPVLNQQNDFVIISHDESGNRQSQVIPYIQAQPEMTLMNMGTSLAAGQLRLAEQKHPLLLGSGGLYQNNRLAVIAGGLVSEEYQAASWRASTLLTDSLRGNLSQIYSLSHDAADGGGKKQGLSHQLSLYYPVMPQLSLTTSANFRSRDYMDAGSSWSSKKTARETGQIKSQYAFGLSFSQPWLGALSLSSSMSQTWQGTEVVDYTLGWGRTFGNVNINLGLQKNRLSDDQRYSDNHYFYLNTSVPLGSNRNLRSWVSNDGQQTRVGAGYDQIVNNKFAWSLSSEKSQRQDQSVSGTATWTNKYSQLSGGASYSDRSNSYNVGARGGMVLHDEGLTFSPRKVGDTFGIISLNTPQPDVEIRTHDGTIWSDSRGYAISSWMPWQKNTVQINLKTLPKNVQVLSGITNVTPYRGSVVPVILPAQTVRRALVTFPEGEGPAPGSPVKDENGVLIAFVNEDGSLFLDNLPDGALFGLLKNGAGCSVELLTPWTDRADSFYASLTARCVS